MPGWRGFPASINLPLTVRIGAAITTIDASRARWGRGRDADGAPLAGLLSAQDNVQQSDRWKHPEEH
jgi:hypothetical protein